MVAVCEHLDVQGINTSPSVVRTHTHTQTQLHYYVIASLPLSIHPSIGALPTNTLVDSM